MASCLNNSSLVKGQRAETAPAKTAAVACNGKAQLLDCGNTALRLIGRMVIAHIRQRVHTIHLVLCQWLCGGILYNIFGILVLLHQAFSRKWIGIAVLGVETFCKGEFIRTYLFKGRQHYRIIN